MAEALRRRWREKQCCLCKKQHCYRQKQRYQCINSDVFAKNSAVFFTNNAVTGKNRAAGSAANTVFQRCDLFLRVWGGGHAGVFEQADGGDGAGVAGRRHGGDWLVDIINARRRRWRCRRRQRRPPGLHAGAYCAQTLAALPDSNVGIKQRANPLALQSSVASCSACRLVFPVPVKLLHIAAPPP